LPLHHLSQTQMDAVLVMCP